MQDPRVIDWKAYGYSPTIPRIQRIQDEAKKDQMPSSWNMSWPNSASMSRLLRPQDTEGSANAADAAQGMLGNSATTSRAEGQFPTSDESPLQG